MLQAEITAIMGTAKHIIYYNIFDKDIAIFTDSLLVIKSLIDVFTKSDLVQECQTSQYIGCRDMGHTMATKFSMN